MIDDFAARNSTDADGMPAGGTVRGKGLTIDWQSGPLFRYTTGQPNPNGAFVETVIAAVKQRLKWLQKVSGGRFACDESKDAISYLGLALIALNRRTQRRTEAGVEGTHEACAGDGPNS